MNYTFYIFLLRVHVFKFFYYFFQTVNAMKEDGFDIKCRVPRMMSETRFPNYVAKVFSVLRYDSEV